MALTSSQIASRLFKQSLTTAETSTSLGYNEEPKITRLSVFPSQIWVQSDLIPTTADPTLKANALATGSSYSVGVVKYFRKHTLNTFSGAANKDISFWSDDLKDAIPLNFDSNTGTYAFEIFKSDGTTPINFGDGDWLVDTNAGVLTFYGTPPSGVNSSNPPKISFYKYIGAKGLGGESGIGTILGVTAGNGLSGGGTAGYITLDVNLGVNSGLTFSGDNIIIDSGIAGNGLDFSSGILTVNTSEITNTLAGSGITSSGGVLNISLGGDSGLTFSGDNIIIDSSIAGNGLDFSSGVLTVNTSEINTGLAGNGLTANGSTLDVNVNSDSLEIVGDVIRLKDTITGNKNFNGDVFIQGSFSVAGSSSVINTVSLVVSDPIIALGHTQTGSPVLDEGFMFVRGTGVTQAFIWDESEDTFALITTNDDHTIIGDVNISGYSNLRLAGLSASQIEITTGAQQDYVLVSNAVGLSTWTSSILRSGTGLQTNGVTVSLDFNSITGIGLTQNGSQLSIDTNGFSNTLAGGGLSSNGGTLSVNVGNGLEIVSDTVYLGGTLSQPTNIEVNGNTLTIESAGGQNQLFFDSSQITLNVSDGSGTASNINFQNTLTNWSYVIGGSESSVYLSNGLSSTDGSNNNGLLVRDSLNKKGIVYEDNYTSNFTTHSLITKGFVDAATNSIWSALDSINNDYITGITAGDGLSGGGTAGFITLDINVGLSSSTGLTISSDILQLSTTGVVAGTYGNSFSIPTFTVDSQGRLTNAGTVSLDLTSGSSNIAIGPAEDGDYTDGIFKDFTPSTPIGTAIDRFNEMFSLLAPTPPKSWAGSISSISFSGTSYTPRALGSNSTVSPMWNTLTPTLQNTDLVSNLDNARVDTNGYTFSLINNGVVLETVTLSGTATSLRGAPFNIRHSASQDPYVGVSGKAGFWKGIVDFSLGGTVTVTATSSIRLLELDYPDGGYVTYSYYIDQALTPSITGLTATIPAMTTFISGVPTLASGQNITSVGFNIPSVSSYFWAPSFVWSVAAGLVNFTSGDPNSIPAAYNETGIVSGRTFSVANNQFSDFSFSFTVTPRNSIAAAGTSATLTTNFFRVDTKSVENRLLSGSGNYPSVYGGSYLSNQSLLSGVYVNELQLKNGIYQYPNGDYTNFGGSDYNTATGVRWATFNLGTFTNDNTFTLNIVGGTNLSSSVGNANFWLEVKIEGVTRWVDADEAFPNVGNPGGGVVDGDYAVVFASSTTYSRRITFGAVSLSGSIIARIGFTSATNITFTSLTATNIS